MRLHLLAEMAYQERLVRFIENHDEPRAAAAFCPEQERAAALTFATLPGARLFHEGQIEGRRVRLPVFLSRRPAEAADVQLADFYRTLLATIASPAFRDGSWRLLGRSGWPDNPTFESIAAWSWEGGDERFVVVVNLSPARADARVRLPWPNLAGREVFLDDHLSGDSYERDGSELLDPGLYVALEAWGFHLLAVGE